LPLFSDTRGKLTVVEFPGVLPFAPSRAFLVFAVPEDEIRGMHAHIEQHQFLICTNGSCAVLLDNGHDQHETVLDNPTLGLHIPPMIWAKQYNFSPDATLLVLASDIYKPDDYINDYNEFLDMVSNDEKTND